VNGRRNGWKVSGSRRQKREERREKREERREKREEREEKREGESLTQTEELKEIKRKGTVAPIPKSINRFVYKRKRMKNL